MPDMFDDFKSSAREERKPVEDFWGSGPGLDWADLWDAPKRAVSSVGEGALGALGTGFKWTSGLVQRPVLTGLTYLAQGGAGRFSGDDILGSITEPERGATGLDLAGTLSPELLASHQRMQDDPYAGWIDKRVTGANVLGFGFDVATDPFTYATGGLSALGKARVGSLANASNVLKQAVAKGGTSAERLAAYEAALTKGGLTIPKAIPQNWTGLSDTLVGRLKAGESGLGLRIPGTKIGTDLTAFNKNVVAPLAVLGTPIGKMVDLVGKTAVGKKLGVFADIFRERPTNTAEGLAEHVARIEGGWATAELANILELPRMQKGLNELVEATGKDPAELTRLLAEYQESHLRWDFKANTAVERTAAERLPFQEELWKKSEKEIGETFTNDQKLKLWGGIQEQLQLARKGFMAVDKKYNLGIGQLGQEFADQLEKKDDAIGLAQNKLDETQGRLSEIDSEIEAVGQARAGLREGGGLGTPHLGTPSLEEQASILHTRNLNAIEKRATIEAEYSAARAHVDDLFEQRKNLHEKLLATPIWVPRQVASDVDLLTSVSTGTTGAKSTMKVARHTYDEVMGLNYGYKVENGKTVFGIIPEDLTTVLSKRLMAGEEKVAQLQALVGDVERLIYSEGKTTPASRLEGMSLRDVRVSEEAARKSGEELVALRERLVRAKSESGKATIKDEIAAKEAEIAARQDALVQRIPKEATPIPPAAKPKPSIPKTMAERIAEAEKSAGPKDAFVARYLKDRGLVAGDVGYGRILNEAEDEWAKARLPKLTPLETATKEVADLETDIARRRKVFDDEVEAVENTRDVPEDAGDFVLDDGGDPAGGDFYDLGEAAKEIEAQEAKLASARERLTSLKAKPAPPEATPIPPAGEVGATAPGTQPTGIPEAVPAVPVVKPIPKASQRAVTETERKLIIHSNDLAKAKAEVADLAKQLTDAGGAPKVESEWHSLNDIPMYREHLQAEFAKHGTGSTAYKTPVKLDTVLQAAAKSMKAGGKAIADQAAETFGTASKMRPAASAEEAKAATEFFSEDIVSALAGKLRRVQNDVTQKMVEESIATGSKSINSTTWNALRTKALEGKATWDEIETAFKKAEGFDISEVLPKNYRKMTPVDAIGEGPAGYVKSIGSGKYSDFHHFNGFVPEEWMRTYSKYRDSAALKTIKGFSEFAEPVMAINRWWKKAQLAPYPVYHLRNTVTDFLRLAQEGATDMHTASDIGVLFKEVMPGVTREGWGDLAKFRGIKVPGLDLDLEAALTMASEQGLLNTGQTWRTIFDAADEGAANAAKRRIKQAAGGEVAKAKQPIMEKVFGQPGAVRDMGQGGGAIPQAKRFIAFREDAMKLSGFFSRLRAGDSPINAAILAQKAMFDYSNLSPFVDFARRSGLSPFLAFSSKNIPAQLRLLAERPVQFAAIMHLHKMLEDGDAPPPEVFGKFAARRYGITVNVGRDENGRAKYEFMTPSGVIPQADLIDIGRNGYGVLEGQLGPIMKAALEYRDQEDLPPEQQKTAGEIALGGLGRPWRLVKTGVGIVYPPWGTQDREEETYRRKTGKAHQPTLLGFPVGTRAGRVQDLIDKFISPMELKSIDAMNNLELEEKRWTNRLAKQKGVVNRERQSWEVARSTLNNGWASESDVAGYKDRFESAQREYQQLAGTVETELRRLGKLKQKAAKVMQAP
jgi:hypothetical protein